MEECLGAFLCGLSCCAECIGNGLLQFCCKLCCSCDDDCLNTDSNNKQDNPRQRPQIGVGPADVCETETLVNNDVRAGEATPEHNRPNQTTDIWNISDRVNQDGTPVTSGPQRWPTHDHHIDMNSYAFPDQIRPHLKDGIPPPPYTEVDLPSYEQATGVPKPKPDLPNVFVTPPRSNPSTNPPGPSS